MTTLPYSSENKTLNLIQQIAILAVIESIFWGNYFYFSNGKISLWRIIIPLLLAIRTIYHIFKIRQNSDLENLNKHAKEVIKSTKFTTYFTLGIVGLNKLSEIYIPIKKNICRLSLAHLFYP